jgi:signal transduction histidine kinase
LFVFDDRSTLLAALAGVSVLAVVGNVLQDHVRDRAHVRAQARAETTAALMRTLQDHVHTPLAEASMRVEDVLTHTRAGLTPHEERALRDVSRAAHGAARTGDLLMAWLDVQEGRVAAQLQPTDPDALARAVFAAWRKPMEHAGIPFALVLPRRPLPPVLVDRDKLRETLMILLENARDYTRPGGKVTLSLREVEGGIQFLVKDTGSGMSADVLAHAFRPFFRGQHATHLKRSGAGIGLSLARYYVRLHGGDIGLQSRLGRGSTVTVDLPS